MVRNWKRFQSPAMFVGAWWLVSLISSAVVLELGDFGIPWWIAGLSFFWVFTIGLPTFLAFTATAWIWDSVIAFGFPLALFVICAAALSLVLHYVVFFLLVQGKKNWRTQWN